jgi:3-oxoadipate enol-lactonase
MPGGNYLQTPHGRLAYDLHGSSGKPWLVLAHALGADRRMWKEQIPAFSKQFQVVAWDHRGHGDSDAGDGETNWTMATLVDDTTALLDHLEIGECTFVGLSLGGSIGLGMAITHPLRITELVCACARADAPEAYRELWRTRAGLVAAGGVERIVDITLERWFTTAAFQHDNDGIVALARQMLVGTDPRGYIGAATALETLDYLKFLDRLRCRTLYLAGEHDLAVAPTVVESAASVTPDGDFMLIEGAAHLANLEYPERFNACLQSWMTHAH